LTTLQHTTFTDQTWQHYLKFPFTNLQLHLWYEEGRDDELTEGSDLLGWYWFFSRLTWSSVVLR